MADTTRYLPWRIGRTIITVWSNLDATYLQLTTLGTMVARAEARVYNGAGKIEARA